MDPKQVRGSEDLNRLRDRFRSEVDLRQAEKSVKVTVHMGTCGIAAGARDVLAELMDLLGKAEATDVMLTQSGCKGLCDQEPVMTVLDRAGQEITYGRLDAQKVREIVDQHLLGGSPVAAYLVNPPRGALSKGEG